MGSHSRSSMRDDCVDTCEDVVVVEDDDDDDEEEEVRRLRFLSSLITDVDVNDVDELNRESLLVKSDNDDDEDDRFLP